MSDPRTPQGAEEIIPDEVEDAENAEVQDDDFVDDGADDDEGDAPDEGQEEDEVEVAPPRAGSRKQNTVAALRLRAQTAETGLTQLQQQFADLQRRINQPAAPDPAAIARAEAEEIERVSLLPVHEQARYWTQKSEQRIAAALQQFTFGNHDQNDRTAFNAMCAGNATMRRLQPQVEQLLGAMRQQGSNQTRENIAYYLIGREAVERARNGGKRAAPAQSRRLVSQTVRPASGRGDVARSNGAGGNSDERLLRSITIDDL